MRTRARWTAFSSATLFLFGLSTPCAQACLAQSKSSLPAPAAKSAPAPEARVDINRASIEQLLKVPGMTPSWAGRIVRFRPYRTKQDLLDRGVLSADVYDRIKDYVIAHREKP